MELIKTDHPLGGALEEAYEDALRAWCKEHAPAKTREDARLEMIAKAEMHVMFKNHGGCLVTVSITGRRPWQDEQYVFVLQRRDKDTVDRVRDSLV